jgi:prenyltransferase beta subunit
LLNFSLMASYGGELSFDRFLVLEGRAVPFDAAHAIGNITLALLAGPAMVRMLQRFRERFEWRRAPAPDPRRPAGGVAGAVTALLVLAICLPLLAPARADAADADAAARWLVTAQNGDGGFGTSPDAKSSTAMTGWAMLGLEAAGRNPLDVGKAGATPVGFLTRRAEDITSTGDLARTVLALVGAGVEPRDFAGRNLLRELRGRVRKNGSFEGWPNATAFSVLALRAAGSPAGLEHSLTWLRKVQNDDGGWGAVPGAQSDPDSTGAVLQVIHNGGVRDRAIGYLRRHQSSGGGFATAGSGTVNSQSTAWAVQGMLAAGVDPGSIHEGGGTGLDYLDRRQAADGHFRYSRTSDQTPVWVTGQVLVAAARRAYPLAAVPLQPESSQPAPSGTTTPVTPSTGTGGSLPATPPLGEAGTGVGAIPQPGRESEGPPGKATGGAGSARGDQPGETAAERVASARLAPEDDSGPPPGVPIGIGTGTALLAGGGTVLLGRRRRW